METRTKIILWFRRVAITEGVSFLLLLFIAMPLKYWANLPGPVKYVGWVHGVLFIAFLSLALAVSIQCKKNFLWFVKAFFASILPFGTFALDRQMVRNGDYG